MRDRSMENRKGPVRWPMENEDRDGKPGNGQVRLRSD
jgi:hypothetical protein